MARRMTDRGLTGEAGVRSAIGVMAFGEDGWFSARHAEEAHHQGGDTAAASMAGGREDVRRRSC